MYPDSTQLGTEYLRPKRIFSRGVKSFSFPWDCETRFWMAMARRAGQRQRVDILRTEIHSCFETEFLFDQRVSLRDFEILQEISAR